MMLANPSNGFSPRDSHHLHGQKDCEKGSAPDAGRTVNQRTLGRIGILNRFREGDV